MTVMGSLRRVLGAASYLIFVLWFIVIMMASPSHPLAYVPGVIAVLVFLSLRLHSPGFLHLVAIFCALGTLACLWLLLLMPFVALLVLLYLALWFYYYWRMAWSYLDDDDDFEHEDD